MKKHLFAFLYAPLLLGFSVYFIFGTLVISETYEVVDDSNEIVMNTEKIEESKGEVTTTDNTPDTNKTEENNYDKIIIIAVPAAAVIITTAVIIIKNKKSKSSID